MARSKGEESDVRRYRAVCTLRAWHNSWTCKCMTTALLWRIENTRGYMKCKRAFGAGCSRASGKLGRVYFENCPLSLSRRVTTNSFPHEFQSSQSCRVDAIDATVTIPYVVAELTLNSRDDRPRDSTAPL